MRERNVPLPRNSAAVKDRLSRSPRTVLVELRDTLTAIKSEMKSEIQMDAKMSRKASRNSSGRHAPSDSAGRAIKQVSAELISVLLDTLGLAASIEWHLHEFRRCTKIPYELTIKDAAGIGLPEGYATVLFHIYHEALSNIARHSAANKVGIEVSIMPEDVTMVISDDGIGIAAEQARNSHLGGLAEICKRAEAFNGLCRISGVPNRGTTLSVHLPLSRAAC